MRALLCAIALLAVASPAVAQPGPPGAAPSEPKQPSNVFGTGAWGGGLNTRVSVAPEDDGKVGFGGVVDLKVASWVGNHFAVGMYAHVTLREWEVIGDVYAALADNLDSITFPLLLVGWLAGTDIAYTGPSLSWYSRRETPSLFVDGGSGLVVLIDPRCPDASTGVGFMTGVGAHFTRSFGLAVRTVWTPPSLHNAIGDVDQTYYTVFLAVEHYAGR